MWDVLVVGGGVSGVCAAVAAARNGAKTLLVERYGFCGGTLTNAGVGPMMTFHAGARRVVGGLAQEIVDRLTARGASPGHVEDTTGYCATVTPFDAEQIKQVHDEMLAEAGCRVLYHTWLAGARVEGEALRSVTVCNKAGLSELSAAVYVDATGDADLCAFAGAATAKGRDGDGLCQPMTANLKIGGVDIGRLRAHIRSHPEDFNIRDLTALDRASRLSMAGFYKAWREAAENGTVAVPREDVLLFETARPGEVIVNTTRVLRMDATDPWQLSEAERTGRRQAQQVFDFLRAHAPGFENAAFLSTGVQIGIRESRRLQGRYVLTAEDLLDSRPFEDAVACGGYPIDIHNPAGAKTFTTHLKKGQVYQIPYRALLACAPENLMASGRCVSVTHEAGAAIRVTPIAMAVGQAAGTAAALASRAGVAPRAVAVSELQAALTAQGAILA